jgi:CBS domain-containing protein
MRAGDGAAMPFHSGRTNEPAKESKMNVGSVMTREVLAVGPKTPLVQAIRLMTQRRVSGVPVIGMQGEVVGILTEGDLLRRPELDTTDPAGWLTRLLRPGHQAETYVLTHGRRVEEVMTLHVLTIGEEAELADAVHLMRQHKVKRLPVTRNGKLVGIISRADLVRRLAEFLPEEMAAASDEDIRRTLLKAIDEETWTSRNMTQVSVDGGVVHLDGCLFDLRERDALEVLAENIPGVRQVDNRIVCIEPNTGAVVSDPLTEPAHILA